MRVHRRQPATAPGEERSFMDAAAGRVAFYSERVTVEVDGIAVGTA